MAVARALYAFEGSQEGDLSFQEDDIIRILRQDESGWWEGQTDDGRRGDFPYNYVEIISPEEVAHIRETSRMVTENKYNRKNNQSSQSDYIARCKILPLPKSNSFQIELTLNTSKKIQGKKALNEFRVLDEQVRYIFPNFDRPLPPMWADKMFISEELSHKRAIVLEIYVQRLIGTETTEFALVSWLNPQAAGQYNVSNEIKQLVRSAISNSSLNSSGGRNSLTVAMMNVTPLARVEYDWLGTDAVELSFKVGDIIAVRSKDTPSKGWWEGETSAGERGLFPFNHVRLLNQQEARSVVLGENLSSNNMSFAQTGQTLTNIQISPSKSKLAKTKNNTGQSSSKIARKPSAKNNSANNSNGSNRKRKTENNWALSDLTAFDELLIDGFTMLNPATNKVLVQKDNANCPCEGDKVVLSYVAFVWDCQKQRLIEFSSSDLPDNNNGKSSNTKANGPIKFVVGKSETIKALERAVQLLETGQESRIVIRPDLGYGEVGLPPNVPPNCHLVYDIRLEAFEAQLLPGPPGININTNNNVDNNNNVLLNNMMSQSNMKMNKIPVRPQQPSLSQGKSLVDAIAKRAEKVQQQEQLDQQDQNYSADNSYGNNFVSSQNQVPIGARPKRKQENGSNKNIKNKGLKTKNIPKVAPPGTNVPKYDLRKLQEINAIKDYDKHGILDPKFMEDQLTDEAFEEAFNCNRAAFLLMPRWKQNKLKKNVGLY